MNEPYGSSHPATQRAVAAALTFAAMLAPYFVFRMSGDSSFLTFWEFAANRYFQALNLLAGDYDSIWTVQGVPMAIAQAWIMRLLQWVNPAGVAQASQLELFSQSTVVMGYLLSAFIVAGSWWTKSLRVADRLTVIAVALALFPVTRWYHWFFAPDYWINELPFYIFSSFWAISVVRRHLAAQLAPPDVRTLILSGLWLTLCFCQKPSLVGFGSLPIVVQLCLTARTVGSLALRALWMVSATALSHFAVMSALFNFHYTPAKTFIKNFWRWILGSARTGTSHVDLSEFLSSDYTLNYPICIGAIILILTAVCCAIERHPRSSKAYGIAALYMILIAAGHVLVVYLRPSGTSVIDFTLFATASIPVSLSFLFVGDERDRTDMSVPRVSTLRFARAAIIVLALVFSFYPSPPSLYKASITLSAQRAMLTAFDAEADYVRSLGRPAVVVISDNRAHPRTIEALALYTGQLGLMLSERSPEANNPPLVSYTNHFRKRILGDTVLVTSPTEQLDFLRSAIASGHAIIWGSLGGAPETEDAFAPLNEIKQHADAVLRSFVMESGGSRTAHVAFLNIPVQMPSTPVNVTAERISPDAVRVSWADPSPLIFNRVHLSVGTGPFYQVAVVRKQRSYVIHNLPANVSYRFRVLAQAGILLSDPSAEVLVQ